MKLVLFIVTLFSANAFAIQTKDCPNRLTYKYSDVELTRTLKSVLDELNDEIGDEAEKASGAYAVLGKSAAVEKTYELVTAKNGRCRYYTKSGRFPSQERIELYSSKGKDIVFAQSIIGPKGVLARVYKNIESLSADGVQLTRGNARVALAIPRHPYDSYSAGGSLIFVGTVSDFELR